jgi:phage terminase large subunit-like protein
MAGIAQQLQREGITLTEFPQTVPNLTRAGQNLYDLLKGGNLIAYADDDLRRQLAHAVAIESSRGWRIAKEKSANKIDAVVALAFAALAAIEHGTAGPAAAVVAARESPHAKPPRSSWQESNASLRPLNLRRQ